MTESKLKYGWQQAVIDAFAEPRPEYPCKKAMMAERVIVQRLSEIEQVDGEERFALRDALHALRVFLLHDDV